MEWRILPFNSYTGAENMAIDEAVFEAQEKKKSPPTIRFYTWKKPCLSLGYFQKAFKELDLNQVKKKSIDVVKRMTGGRVVLHIDELTYSVSATVSLLSWCKTQRLSYEFISKSLLKTLQGMNLELNLSRSDLVERSEKKTMSPCFSSSARNEVVFENKKLIGSAQKRSAFAFLQHGSILCSNKSKTVIDYLNLVPEDRNCARLELAKKATCLEEILNQPINILELHELIFKNFLNNMGIIKYKIGELTTFEEVIVNEKLSKSSLF